MIYFHDIDPIAISLGPIQVHWYGIMYLLAFLTAWWLGRMRTQAGRLPDAVISHVNLAEVIGRLVRDGRNDAEIDLILQDPQGTVVFVEVRSRSRADFGGAGGSIGAAKRQRVVATAQHWLQRHGAACPCRFDVVLIEGEQLQWLQAAFDAG